MSTSSGLTAACLGDLEEAPFSSGLSLPVGTRWTLRAQAGSWGRPTEAGPGWERDRPLRRAGTSWARGGGARGSSPGAGVAAPAAGGSAAAASAPAAARRRGRGRALRPSSGCSRGAGGGVPAEPEPSRCPSLARVRARRRAGPPLSKSPRSASSRAAPPPQVRARSPRCKVFWGTAGPRCPGPARAAHCLPLGFLRAARCRALYLHHRLRLTCARL